MISILMEGDRTASVYVRLPDSSGGGGRLPGSLGGELLPGSLSSGGLTGGLLGTGHGDGSDDTDVRGRRVPGYIDAGLSTRESHSLDLNLCGR